jgi:hypothetical protein
MIWRKGLLAFALDQGPPGPEAHAETRCGENLMWGHRLFGAVLALAGAAALGVVLALFYVPIPQAQDTLIEIGIPGVLSGGLCGVVAVVIGLWFVLAPALAARHTRGLIGRLGDGRKT